MLKRTQTYKKIILNLVLVSTLTTLNPTICQAITLGGTYNASIEVKDYTELQNEIANALKIGATKAIIPLNSIFKPDFYNTYNSNFNNIINESKFKADDYHVNLLKSIGGSTSNNNAIYEFTYLESALESQKVESEVKNIISKIITFNMSEDEKVKAIHDYIATHVQYDSNGLAVNNESHTAYAALFNDKAGDPNETVCQGYALLFYQMATTAGLQARIMTGTAGGPHAWNLIRINGYWYQMDITWDDPVGVPDPTYKRYDYFNLTDDMLKKDHSIFNNPDKYPICNTIYANKSTNQIILDAIGLLPNTKLVASSRNDFKNILSNSIKKGMDKIDIQYASKSIWDILDEIKAENPNLIDQLNYSYSTNPDYTLHITVTYKDKVTTLNTNSTTLTLGKSTTLKTTGTALSGKTNDLSGNCIYLSSNTNVVSIDSFGNVLPKALGEASILVKYGDIKEVIPVKVIADVKSNNANLADLKINGTIINNFDKNCTSYNFEFPANYTGVPSITTSLEDSKSVVNISNLKNLSGSEADRTSVITVTAEDGSTKTYKVIFSVKSNVNPVPKPTPTPVPTPTPNPNPVTNKSNNSNLTNIKINGTVINNFDKNCTSYNFEFPANYTGAPSITASLEDSKSVINISNPKNLNGSEADRTSVITVTAEDGSTKTYKVIFSVKSNVNPVPKPTPTPVPTPTPNPNPVTNKSNNSNLTNIKINGTVISNFDKNCTSYNFEFPTNYTGTTSITASLEDSKSVVNISNPKNLNGSEADRTSVITVTAENGSTKTYKVIFSVKSNINPVPTPTPVPNPVPVPTPTPIPVANKSNNSNLSNIKINGTVINNFNKNCTSYKFELPANYTDEPSMAASLEDSKSVINISKPKNLNGSEADRTSVITVTAEDGSIKTYKITFSIKVIENATNINTNTNANTNTNTDINPTNKTILTNNIDKKDALTKKDDIAKSYAYTTSKNIDTSSNSKNNLESEEDFKNNNTTDINNEIEKKDDITTKDNTTKTNSDYEKDSELNSSKSIKDNSSSALPIATKVLIGSSILGALGFVLFKKMK